MFKRGKQLLAAFIGLNAMQIVQADLPVPVPPSTAPAAGDWIGLIEGYIKDGGLVLGLAIAILGFLWIAYLAFAKFNEARQGRAESQNRVNHSGTGVCLGDVGHARHIPCLAGR